MLRERPRRSASNSESLDEGFSTACSVDDVDDVVVFSSGLAD